LALLDQLFDTKSSIRHGWLAREETNGFTAKKQQTLFKSGKVYKEKVAFKFCGKKTLRFSVIIFP
jgi:hypothetical protein